MKCAHRHCPHDADVRGYCWFHYGGVRLTYQDVCYAWALMKDGARIEEAARTLGVLTLDLNLALNTYQGYPKKFELPQRPAPMF